MVNRLVKPGAAVREPIGLAQKLAEHDLLAMRISKRLVRGSVRLDDDRARALELLLREELRARPAFN